MILPRVYADFNAIEHRGDGTPSAEMELTGYGTLASLARQRLRLEEGMHVVLYEPNDIECEAVVHFDRSRIDPVGRVGAWIAQISDHREIRNSTQPEESRSDHPCADCGVDFGSQFASTGRNYTEVCENCGASVMGPLEPPSAV